MNRAGTSIRVPEVRVGQTNYPGTKLVPVTWRLIIEYKDYRKRPLIQRDWLVSMATASYQTTFGYYATNYIYIFLPFSFIHVPRKL